MARTHTRTATPAARPQKGFSTISTTTRARTLLLTDVEGSTVLWSTQPDSMRRAMLYLNEIVGDCALAHGGEVHKRRGEGDSSFVVFLTSSGALAAAADIQRSILQQEWSTDPPLRIRIGVHSCEAIFWDDDYVGPEVNRCARIRSMAHGGQTFLSAVTKLLAGDKPPDRTEFVDLGRVRLAGLEARTHVFALRMTDVSDREPQLRANAGDLTNLRLPQTPLIGRAESVRRVRDRLAHYRLVTIRGVSGIGKTRVALEVAETLMGATRDGVWLVDIGALTDGQLAATALAGVLGEAGVSGEGAIDAVARRLADADALIVLDGCEQAREACSELALRLLVECPDVRVLATTIGSLGLPAEALVDLPPLSTDGGATEDWLSAALELFLDRARRVHEGFELTSANRQAVLALCRAVSGLPLGIELAASYAGSLPLGAIAQQLQREHVDPDTPIDAATRQRSLQRAVAWTIGRLTENERTLFEALCVCRGTFDLDAIEALAAMAGLKLSDTWSVVTGLVDRTVVRFVPTGVDDARYEILLTLREAGLRRLQATDRLDVAELAHLRHYAAVAQSRERELTGSEQARVLDELEWDLDNFRMALTTVRERSRWTDGLLLASALWCFWPARGSIMEGIGYLDGLLRSARSETNDPVPDKVLGKALVSLGNLAYAQGDDATAARAYCDSLAIWRSTGNTMALATTLDNYGLACSALGRHDEARKLHAEGLSLARSLRDDALVAKSSTNLGVSAMNACEWDAAAEALAQAAATHAALGHAGAHCRARALMAEVHAITGRTDEALELLRDCLASQGVMEDRSTKARVLMLSAHVHRIRGEHAPARDALDHALDLAAASGARLVEAESHVEHGRIDLALGHHASALRRAALAADAFGDVGRHLAYVRMLQGDVALAQDQHSQAASRFQDALAEFDSTRNALGVARVLARLALVEAVDGDLVAARDLVARALRRQRRMGRNRHWTSMLEQAAVVVSCSGEQALAGRLLIVADELRARCVLPRGQAGDESLRLLGASAVAAAARARESAAADLEGATGHDSGAMAPEDALLAALRYVAPGPDPADDDEPPDEPSFVV